MNRWSIFVLICQQTWTYIFLPCVYFLSQDLCHAKPLPTCQSCHKVSLSHMVRLSIDINNKWQWNQQNCWKCHHTISYINVLLVPTKNIIKPRLQGLVYYRYKSDLWKIAWSLLDTKCQNKWQFVLKIFFIRV